MTNAIREHADGVILSVRVQPGAKRTALIGERGGALKIAVAAPPVEGKANAALIDFLKELFRVKKSQVELIQGEKSRVKVLLLRGITMDAASEKLKLL